MNLERLANLTLLTTVLASTTLNKQPDIQTTQLRYEPTTQTITYTAPAKKQFVTTQGIKDEQEMPFLLTQDMPPLLNTYLPRHKQHIQKPQKPWYNQ